MVYRHPKSLSPDPTYGRKAGESADGFTHMDLYPHRLVRSSPVCAATKAWGATLNLYRRPGPVGLMPRGDRRCELVLDFGTELDATLEVELDVPGLTNLSVWLGESELEAEGFVPGQNPSPIVHRHLRAAGRHRVRFDPRGFRFARLMLQDMTGPATLRRVVAHADFAFTTREGDFRCDDKAFQVAWQTSAYTARLCTRPDTLWDGIKRDRAGWFGDGRIVKLATDNIFFSPIPAEKMLLSLPTDEWANCVPTYSFDAVAMLRQHVLLFGRRPCVRPAYELVRKMLGWVEATQTDRGGFIVRTDQLYFGDIGFVDWSKMPVGGRFEELSWLQCKYVEALRGAADLAGWLGHERDAAAWAGRADKLSKRILKTFWRDGVGMIHTLNHVGEVSNPHVPGYGGHYRKTYVEKIRLGPSGPTRQANALAVLAGLLPDDKRKIVLDRVFDNPRVEPITTAYFAHYEQSARALCGDAAGALRNMRDYLWAMIQREDAATIWELWSPEIDDLRKYSSHFELGWRSPLSLCHGWGAGIVPLTTRFLLGIDVVKPGFSAITISPEAGLKMAFEATVPTPHGPIRVERESPAGPIRYRVPREISVVGRGPGWLIEQG